MNSITEDIKLRTDLILTAYSERNVDYPMTMTARPNNSR